MLDMGILYFYQKPLVSGFTIENEVACVWSDTEAFIGTFQEVQTMMSGIPGKTWISNLQKTYGHQAASPFGMATARRPASRKRR